MGQTLGNMCHFLLYRVGTWPWPIKHRRTFGNLFLEAHEIFMKKIIINYHELSKRLGVDPAFYCDLRLNHLQGPTAPGLRDRLHRDWGAWLFAHVQQIHRGRSSLRLGLSHWMCIIVDGYIVYIRMYMCIYIIYTYYIYIMILYIIYILYDIICIWVYRYVILSKLKSNDRLSTLGVQSMCKN